MVNIDTVYQRVLALANKEQRGYITPQEFNLFANQAQLEILNKYSPDISGASKVLGNEEEYSDPMDILDQKLGVFKTEVELPSPNGVITFPSDLYILGSVWLKPYTEADQLNENELRKIMKSNLTRPNKNRPVYTLSSVGATIYPNWINKVEVSYIRKPMNVAWGYVVINNKALYDPAPGKTFNFELHASEETELVYKILKLSGVAIQRTDIAQFAAGMEKGLQQNKKQ